MNHASWLRPLHDPFELRRVTNLIVAEIGKLNPRPSFIAVRGTSGTAIGGAVSLVSDLPMVIVRKETDNSHAKPWGDVQGLSGLSGPFVVVDDLVDSGATVTETVSAVMHAVSYDNKWKTECIAVLLYSEDQIKTGSFKVGETDIPLIAPNRNGVND